MTCDSAYRLQSYTWSRPNVVSVLIGYRILEKFMFSFQTCELPKFLPKYRIVWPIPSYLFFWNLAILFSNSSLGSEKLKQNRHSLIKSRFPSECCHDVWCEKKLEWCGYPTVKKFWRYIYLCWQNVRTWQTDGQTHRHRMTRQKNHRA